MSNKARSLQAWVTICHPYAIHISYTSIYCILLELSWIYLTYLSDVICSCQNHCPNATWHHLTWGSPAILPAGQSQAELKHKIQIIQLQSLQSIQNYGGPSSPLSHHIPTLRCPGPCANEVRRRLWLLPDQWVPMTDQFADCFRLHCPFRIISSNWCFVERSSSALMEDWWHDRNERSGLKG
jgi:hypothetical protein